MTNLPFQDEYEAWRAHNADRLPEMDEEQLLRMEGATGIIPLFLNALLTPEETGDDGKADESKTTFDAAYERLLQHPLIQDIPVQLAMFTTLLDKRFADLHFEHLSACVLEMRKSSPNPVCYDHRYLYFGADNKMHCVNNFVRGCVTDLLHKHKSSMMLEPSWLNSCSNCKNPSVKGFLAENIVIAYIRNNGLVVDELLKPDEFLIFAKGTEAAIVDKKSGTCILYIPDIFNYKAIDLLLRRVPTNKQNNVVIAPVHVTLQAPAQHKKSIAQFFEGHKKWIGGATKVAWHFVWITRKAGDPKLHEADVANGIPAYTEHRLTFAKVCPPLEFLK